MSNSGEWLPKLRMNWTFGGPLEREQWTPFPVLQQLQSAGISSQAPVPCGHWASIASSLISISILEMASLRISWAYLGSECGGGGRIPDMWERNGAPMWAPVDHILWKPKGRDGCICVMKHGALGVVLTLLSLTAPSAPSSLAPTGCILTEQVAHHHPQLLTSTLVCTVFHQSPPSCWRNQGGRMFFWSFLPWSAVCLLPHQ